MKLLPIAALFDAVEPRILRQAVAAMQEACSGSNLRKLRENAKLTQDALAGRVGLTQSALSHLEAGTNCPPVGTAVALWLALTHGVTGVAEPGRDHYEILGDIESWEREQAIERAGQEMRARNPRAWKQDDKAGEIAALRSQLQDAEARAALAESRLALLKLLRS